MNSEGPRNPRRGGRAQSSSDEADPAAAEAARGEAPIPGPAEAGPSGRVAPAAARRPRRAAAPQDPPDRELVEAARNGSHEAFEALVRRYSERAYRVAYRILRNPDQSEDVLQEALIKAYRAIRSFEQRSAFYTWLYRIVVNLALDRRRRDKSAGELEWEDAVAPRVEARAVIPEADDPERAARRGEIREVVARGIQELPDGQREVLLLREVEGLSYEEIAATMAISKGTVMSRLHYARRKMEAFLRRQGIEPEDAA